MAQLLYATKFLSLFTRNNWIFVSRRKNPDELKLTPDAVSICAMHTDELGVKRIVLVDEFRHPLNRRQISFPAGLVDANESIETTAIREFKEETGLVFSPLFSSPRFLANSGGLTDETSCCVCGTATGTASATPGIDLEDIRVCMLTRDELKVFIEDPNLMFGSRTWPILASLAHTGSFCQLSF